MIFVIGFLFISIIGTILHFVYDYSDHNKVVGLFSAVNESTWEHIKIALTPAFLYSIIDGYFYGYLPNYFPAKLVGILAIIIVIPLIFYTYKIFTKKSILVIDISSFFITIFISELLTYKILIMKDLPYAISYLSLICIFIIFAFYLLVTVFPLKNVIFKDPITKKYGIKGHPENVKDKNNKEKK